jgi:hypothetical protein
MSLADDLRGRAEGYRKLRWLTTDQRSIDVLEEMAREASQEADRLDAAAELNSDRKA